MIDWFITLNPIIQALIATCFTWFATALGAAAVFFFKSINRKVLDGMLGVAAGVMIAASVWSLIIPAIEMAEEAGKSGWLSAAIGFLTGGAFLALIHKILPHLHFGSPTDEAEGVKTSWHRSVLLVLAITLHNFPEGLAVGVAFGAASYVGEGALGAAVALTIGMTLQNMPEGLAVSVPLRREGMSRTRSFLYGQATGMVEPFAGVLGAVAVFYITAILPFALAFAAGAMIFVVVEELIPESQVYGNGDIATAGLMIGFTLMMVLDVALG
jgi:ZIP family zinc transporter